MTTPTTSDSIVAKANPTKEFFVRMLTRDISIQDCILDLIDNSVDAAWEQDGGEHPGLETSNRLSNYKIKLDITDELFRISDNCGGLTLKNAQESAFNFGNPSQFNEEDSTLSVGVYGIGMKRAIFKLGSEIEIESTFQNASDALEAFVVKIDVEKWLTEDAKTWTFPIFKTEPANCTGLTITVRKLREDVHGTFGNSFVNRLRDTISRDYMMPLGHGLNITLNDRPVIGEKMTLMSSPEFVPYHQSTNEGDVHISVFAGMGGKPSSDDDPNTPALRRSESGWNIFCNGRAVLTNDTSSISGWGAGKVPKWHPQYNGFKGYVFFTSKTPSLLPMTTTKRDVDEGALVYKKALGMMADPAKAWTKYTNLRKDRKKQAEPKEKSASPKPLDSLDENDELGVPDLGETDPVANISFSKPIDQVRALGRAFGDSDMTYREVGIKAFEYSFNLRVDEEEI